MTDAAASQFAPIMLAQEPLMVGSRRDFWGGAPMMFWGGRAKRVVVPLLIVFAGIVAVTSLGQISRTEDNPSVVGLFR